MGSVGGSVGSVGGSVGTVGGGLVVGSVGSVGGSVVGAPKTAATQASVIRSLIFILVPLIDY